MIDIKFRAWDIIEKKFIYTSVLDIVLGNAGSLLHEEMEFQLFTGLSDKNGKEIYEGDIVKVSDGKERGYVIGEVVYMPVSFRLRNCLVFFPNGTKEYWKEDFCWNTRLNIEVIGNKFENPELLKNGVIND